MPEQPRAVDANVILRYLLDDLPDQAAKARRLIESDEVLGLTAVTLAEIAWTLAGPRYRIDRGTVALRLIELLGRENLVTIGFDKGEAQASLATCTSGAAAHLGDALVAACARSAGVRDMYSFDESFDRTGMVTIVPL